MLWNCSGNSKADLSNVKEDDFIFQYIDSSVSPGEDFFKFATGTWMKQNPIPSSERRWAVSNLVQNDIYDKLLKISNEAAADNKAEKGSNTQRIGDFWSTGMDSATIETQGLTPLTAQLEMINSIKSKEDVLNTMALFQINIGSPMFAAAIYQDEMNSTKYTLHF